MDDFTFATQKDEMEASLNKHLPRFKELILSLARPSVHMFPNKGTSQKQSHFLGKPIAPDVELLTDAYDRPKLHVATFYMSDFPNEVVPANCQEVLSFYVLEGEYFYGWSQDEDNFDALNYPIDEASFLTSYFDEMDQEQEIGFHPPFNFDQFPILEPPSLIHPLLMNTFSSSESESYRKYILKPLLWDRLKAIQSKRTAYHHLILPLKFGGINHYNRIVDARYQAERISSNRDYASVTHEEASKWQLLLQLSPWAYDFRMSKILNYGCIQFMIKSEDFSESNFEHALAIVQWRGE